MVVSRFQVLWLALFAPIATVCASAPPNPEPDTRFGTIAEIVIAPDSGVELRPAVSGQRVAPEYPLEARRDGVEARPVVAYVVDTVGRIEIRTLTFLDPAPPVPFRLALCNWAREAHLTPLRRSGRAQRALIVQGFAFELAGGTRWGPDTKPYRAWLQSTPPAELFQRLDRLPRC